MARPDGFHWIAPTGARSSALRNARQAEAARDASDDNAAAPTDALQAAENEFGVADWIDPATGEPAEGACPPHLDED